MKNLGALVLTGYSDKKPLAVKQIDQSFAASKRFKVGEVKRDSKGMPIQGVTAVTVKDVLPM